MFGKTHRTITEHKHFIDNTTKDEVIKTKIKECQRENGRCMEFTSKRLRIFYGDEKVSHILQRLSRRRECGNNYQEIFSL
jgi:hypothetical protein